MSLSPSALMGANDLDVAVVSGPYGRILLTCQLGFESLREENLNVDVTVHIAGHGVACWTQGAGFLVFTFVLGSESRCNPHRTTTTGFIDARPSSSHDRYVRGRP